MGASHSQPPPTNRLANLRLHSLDDLSDQYRRAKYFRHSAWSQFTEQRDRLFELITVRGLVVDFYWQLTELLRASRHNLGTSCDLPLSSLRNEDGMTLLHGVVASGRTDLLLMLFRAGCWKDLINERVGTTLSRLEYSGRTATDIAKMKWDGAMMTELQGFTSWEQSLNQFHRVARNGSVSEFERLVAAKPQSLTHMYDLDSQGCSTLYWACVSGNTRLVKKLIYEFDIDPLMFNKQRETLLHVACEMAHRELIMFLSHDIKINPTLKDNNDMTSLKHLVRNSDVISFRQVVDNFRPQSAYLVDSLLLAASLGSLQFVRYLLDFRHLDPRVTDDVGLNALTAAAYNGQLEVVRFLLTRDVDLTAVGLRQRNVLHAAVASPSADIANVQVFQLVFAEMRRRGLPVRRLVNARDVYYGYDMCRVVQRADTAGGAPVYSFVELRRNIVDVFEKRAFSSLTNLGDLDSYGLVWRWPYSYDPVSMRKQLENYYKGLCRADEYEKQRDMTPLHLAVFGNKIVFVDLLLKCGADPNKGDLFGMTALHIAAMRGNRIIVEKLLRHGALPHVVDKSQKTPFDVAADNEHWHIVDFMRDVSNYSLEEAIRRESSTANDKDIECPICFSAVASGVGFKLKACQHSFCRSCLNHYIAAAETAGVECPMRCGSFMSHYEIRKLVNNTTYNKLVERSLSECELAAGSTARHCKTVNCPYWVLLDMSKPCGATRNYFVCEVCHYQNCIDCDAIHTLQTCSQYKQTIANRRNLEIIANERAISEMIANMTAMQCPRATCKHVITKNGGCQHMICHCGRRFDWY